MHRKILRCLSLLAVCLLAFSIQSGHAAEETETTLYNKITVSASGKDAATASANARVAAIRVVLQKMAAPEFLRNNADAVRKRLILAGDAYTGQVEILASQQEKLLTKIEAAVEIDEAKIRRTMLEISPTALNEQAALAAAAPKNSPESSAQSAADDQTKAAEITEKSVAEPGGEAEKPAEAVTPAGPITEDSVVRHFNENLSQLAPSIEVTMDDIHADLDTRSILCENVSVTMPKNPEMTIRISKILINGIDAATYGGSAGDLTEIEKVSFQGIKVTMGETPAAELNEYSVEGLSIAYRDFLKALREAKSQNTEEPLRAMAPAQNIFKAKLILADTFKADAGGMKIGIESLSIKDIGPAGCGPASLRNIQVTLQEQPIYSLGEFGWAGITLPEIFTRISRNPEQADTILQELMGDPLAALDKLAVDGLSWINMRNNFPQTIPVALAKFVCALRVENKTASLTGDLSELSLALSQLQGEHGFTMLSEAAGGQDILLNVTISATVDSERKITFTSSVQEKQKGNISLGTVFALPPDSAEMLHECEFKAEDNGIVDLLLGAGATISKVEGDYAQFLQSTVADVQGAREAFTDPGLTDGIDKVAKLIQDGGTFSFALRPENPVDLNSLGELMGSNPAALGYSFTYAAPAAPKKR
jgi:hypothetical protein